MRRLYIASGLFLLLAVAGTLNGCKEKGAKDVVAASKAHKQEYTCPMHPQIIRDKPGKCPICGMDLVPRQVGAEDWVADTSLARLLKPVNEQVLANVATVFPDNGTRIFSMPVQGTIAYDTRNRSSIASRVAGRIERLYLKYNYQPVQRGQVIMEIYSPDLAAAQRELLFIAQSGSDAALLARARERLLLLGMQAAQIQSVLRTGKILYRVPVYSPVSGYVLEQAATTLNAPQAAAPAAGGSSGMDAMGGGGMSSAAASAPAATTGTTAAATPLLTREGQYVGAGQTIFTVYRNEGVVAEFALPPQLASSVKKGQKLVFFKTAAPESAYTGSIGLIQPTLRAGTSFTLARVYLSNRDLQVGQLVTARIPVVNRGWWLPASAVLNLGGRSVVFRKEKNVFVPEAIQVRLAFDDLVLVEARAGGWEVARNAAFLVDSESFIRLNSENQTESK